MITNQRSEISDLWFVKIAKHEQTIMFNHHREGNIMNNNSKQS